MISRRAFLATLAATGVLASFGAVTPAEAALDPQINPDGYLEVGDQIELTLKNMAFINGEPIDSVATVRVTGITRDFQNGYEDVTVEGGFMLPRTIRLRLSTVR